MNKTFKTKLSIPKMDCPSEEKMVRMALEPLTEIKKLNFDFKLRELEVIHNNDANEIVSALMPLNYGTQLKSTEEHEIDLEELEETLDPVKESNVLKILLAINGSMFVLEIILGLIAQSMGLIADSLDMLADAAVYGLSLYAVGKTIDLKKRAARLSGYLQIFLALGVLIEVARRFMFGSEPEGSMMIGVAFLALIANVGCLFVLFKHREGEVHMKASWIFSTNDVIANLGVILAGILVSIFKTPIPDFIIGIIVAVIVFRGALSILSMAKTK
jgi:Co/Zn/Cd efflux system component